jgi:hypothetical protein
MVFGDLVQGRDRTVVDGEGVSMSLEQFSVGDHGVERKRAHPSQVACVGPQETTIRNDHSAAWTIHEAEILEFLVQ